ncbi:MAG: WYL domain-containing protein [Lachnospiraceae bacterium]|nr:WYL domain-containing protein [Lachnospiraceae bacterium]
MAYSELIKDFERIRNYMREFFAYGFKSRDEYSSKSVRSYDNERRRIESWLGDCMSFRQTESGKNIFISLDIRDMERNPLFKAFKAKSFTDRDITLFFYVMDILSAGEALSAAAIYERIADQYLDPLGAELDFDLSTLRKKLKEFEGMGLLHSRKSGNKLLYSRTMLPELDKDIENYLGDAIAFFTEEAPLGVIGSYISDRASAQGMPLDAVRFSHKHHYILDVLDGEIMLDLLTAIREKRLIEIHAVSKRGRNFVWSQVPLAIYSGTQQGRYYLIGFGPTKNDFDSIRIDNIHSVRQGECYPEYDAVMNRFIQFRQHMWGVSFKRGNKINHVEMDVNVGEGEEYIIKRLRREARCGTIMQISENTWRYTADVYDTEEMLPWIRTFTGRIKRLTSSDGQLEKRFYEDLREICRVYMGAEGETGNAVS